MRVAVAIFAKTIGLSPVKTRLAADIGKEKAEAFYALSKSSVEAVVRTAQSKLPDVLFPAWVLAEREGPIHVAPGSFPAYWTGDGDLGRRLANVSEALFAQHDCVMLIGTDSPHLRPGVLLESVRLLQENPEAIVVGPAHDGGFYLFASQKPVPREIWEKVKYSCDTTLQELEWLLDAKGWSSVHLPVEHDVDQLEELKIVIGKLAALGEEILPEQAELAKWLEKNLP